MLMVHIKIYSFWISVLSALLSNRLVWFDCCNL